MAEVGLALTSPRDGASYRSTLAQIGAWGRRLRGIVEHLLFLARFDAKAPTPGDEPTDLVTLAETCGLRFAAIVRAKDIRLSVVSEGSGSILIGAPPALVDRLCGVLLDNACGYAPAGGARMEVLWRRLSERESPSAKKRWREPGVRPPN